MIWLREVFCFLTVRQSKGITLATVALRICRPYQTGNAVAAVLLLLSSHKNAFFCGDCDDSVMKKQQAREKCPYESLSMRC
jgi:hypothetical protein